MFNNNQNDPWGDNDNSPFENFNTPKWLNNLNSPKNNIILIVIFIVLMVLLWLGTGFYRISAGEIGIELLFGKYNKSTPSGLHWLLPKPIGNIEVVNISKVRRLDIGFRGVSNSKNSLMITGDQNIVDLNFTVYWQIKDQNGAKKYLFNIKSPEEVIKAAAESSMREVMGQTSLQDVLTNKKQYIINKATTLIQKMLNSYKAGIQINNVELLEVNPPSQVIDAFDEVQRAKQDKEKFINEANAYKNKIIPEAKGKASQIINEAEAYKQEQINLAQGEAEKFKAIYKSYLLYPEVTKKRLYLETMEEILDKTPKAIIPNQRILPYMPIPGLKAKNNQQ